jgi:hypothetical protein
MNCDQVAQARRIFEELNAAADRAIDQVSRSSGPMDQVTGTRLTLKQLNDAADRAIDELIFHSPPKISKKVGYLANYMIR